MTQTPTESLKLEILANAQDRFASMLNESFHCESNIVPIRLTKRPALRYLRQELRKASKEKRFHGTHLSRRELRDLVEETAQSHSFYRYHLGLKTDEKGVPKTPYQPTFIGGPTTKGGQEYWVRISYAEAFNAGR